MRTAPAYGVAASPVAWKISTGGAWWLVTSMGRRRPCVGQKAHGALYQALLQVMKCAFSCTAQLSARHRPQSRGQRASRHITAV